jgi:hypothetical protein
MITFIRCHVEQADAMVRPECSRGNYDAILGFSVKSILLWMQGDAALVREIF